MAQTTNTRSGFHSSNPVLSEKFVENHLSSRATRSMSVGGVSVKTIVLLIVLVAGGAWGWASATKPVAVDLGSGYANTTVTIPGGFWLASFGAFLLGIMIAVQPRRAALLGALYAVCEGFCLGAISAMFDAQTEGIVGAAILSTMCVFVVALLLYVTRHHQAHPEAGVRRRRRDGRARRCSTSSCSSCRSSTGAGSTATTSGPIGVVVTLIAIVLAALSLVLDFGTIEAGVPGRARRRTSSGTWPSG